MYTRESFVRAKELLADGGLVVVRFGYEKPFIADRMHRTLGEVFGTAPLTFGVTSPVDGLDGLIMVSGDTAAARGEIARRPALATQVADWNKAPMVFPGTTPVATDDWPYLYLESAHIPLLYFLLAGVLVVLFLRTALKLPKGSFPKLTARSPWHFPPRGGILCCLRPRT